jgi:hypothetical protein
MVVWVAMSTGWLVGFTDGDSALFIKGFRDRFFPQVATCTDVQCRTLLLY